MRQTSLIDSMMFGALLAATAACSSGSGSASGTGGAAGANTGGASTGGANTGGANTGGANTGGANTGGSGTGGAAGTGGGGAGGCPTVDLGGNVPVHYDGTTVGKPNIVTSSRLEWTDAGDDALLFTAPANATYRISMPVGEGGCGASVREYGPNMDGMGSIYDPSWCPATGQSVEIDGVFAAIPPDNTDDVTLAQGQQVLIWVSCAYWSTPLEAPYQIAIEQL
jgi:hypothetical protein